MVMAIAEHELTLGHLQRTTRLRSWLCCGLFVCITSLASGVLLLSGETGAVVLATAMAVVALCALTFWRPQLGLYAAAFLDLVMEPEVVGDRVSSYTGMFFADLNTSFHVGVAFNPLELLLIVTTLSYVLRSLQGGQRLRGGALGPPVLIFGLFLVFGYAWGLATNGDWKIGLFEVRGPFMLVMLYFLVTNLVEDRRQLEQLLRLVMTGLGVLAVWGLLRFYLVFQGSSGGPDGAFGRVHEDAIFLAFLGIIALLRLVFGGPARQTLLLVLGLIPAMVVMFNMERRAAFISIYFAFLVIAVALFHLRRRIFWAIVPATTLLMLGYSAAFWNSESTLAQPVRAWRSQTTSAALGGRDYSSNLYRVLEKADVRDTIRSAPITGIGFGRSFMNTHPLPVLSWWPFQFYMPHAEVLWIWLKVGAGGFIAFWVIICASLMRAGEVVRRVGASPTGFACLVAATYIVMLLVYAYVDVGLANERCEVLLGAMLGVIAVATRLARAQATEACAT